MAVRFTVNSEEVLQCLWRFSSLLQMYARDPVTILALSHCYNSWFIASMRRLSKLVPLQKITK